MHKSLFLPNFATNVLSLAMISNVLPYVSEGPINTVANFSVWYHLIIVNLL